MAKATARLDNCIQDLTDSALVEMGSRTEKAREAVLGLCTATAFAVSNITRVLVQLDVYLWQDAGL